MKFTVMSLGVLRFESLLNQVNILTDWILIHFNQIIFSVITVAIV